MLFTPFWRQIFRMISPHCTSWERAGSMTKGVYRTTLPNGTEVAYVDKGDGKTIGLMRDRYESQGYKPVFDKLPEK